MSQSMLPSPVKLMWINLKPPLYPLSFILSIYEAGPAGVL